MSVAITIPIAGKFYCVVDKEVVGTSEYLGYWEYRYRISAMRDGEGKKPTKLVRVGEDQSLGEILCNKSLHLLRWKGVIPVDQDLTEEELIEVLESIEVAVRTASEQL